MRLAHRKFIVISIFDTYFSCVPTHTSKVTENTSQFMLDETMMTLQELSRNDKLQSFGIQVSVAPYVYHNPPLNL